MKVKELIAKLKTLHPERDIFIGNSDDYGLSFYEIYIHEADKDTKSGFELGRTIKKGDYYID